MPNRPVSGRSMRLRLANGRLVSAKSKTGRPECSRAMSAFMLILKGRGSEAGMTREQATAQLGKCRSMAYHSKRAESLRASGKEAQAQAVESRVKRGLTTAKERTAKADELRAVRAERIKARASAAARSTPKPDPSRVQDMLVARRKAQVEANVSAGMLRAKPKRDAGPAPAAKPSGPLQLNRDERRMLKAKKRAARADRPAKPAAKAAPALPAPGPGPKALPKPEPRKPRVIKLPAKPPERRELAATLGQLKQAREDLEGLPARAGGMRFRSDEDRDRWVADQAAIGQRRIKGLRRSAWAGLQAVHGDQARAVGERIGQQMRRRPDPADLEPASAARKVAARRKAGGVTLPAGTRPIALPGNVARLAAKDRPPAISRRARAVHRARAIFDRKYDAATRFGGPGQPAIDAARDRMHAQLRKIVAAYKAVEPYDPTPKTTRIGPLSMRPSRRMRAVR